MEQVCTRTLKDIRTIFQITFEIFKSSISLTFSKGYNILPLPNRMKTIPATLCADNQLCKPTNIL